MTKGAPHNHFNSKDDLFLAVCVREVTRLGNGLTRTLAGQGSLRVRLKVGVRGVIESTTGDFDQSVQDFDSHFAGI
jgi:AcrR family transcriptional regulator